ncbi:MAG TPA: hypothetical protein VJN89_17795 [Candidatus Acidoferrum sp.]|nr:hypothetical protein [Candidatus Acidoferrum sp.]
MKRFILALGLAGAVFGASACKQRASDSAGIRSGILHHLNAIGTLNMSAMDMDVRSVSINGNQAHAEVEFRPKGNGVPGAGMQVGYNLEKQDGTWIVLKTRTLGGSIHHPDPNQNPHVNQDVYSGALPNFSDILSPVKAPAQGPLPPGHPPLNSQQSAPKSASTNQKLP